MYASPERGGWTPRDVPCACSQNSATPRLAKAEIHVVQVELTTVELQLAEQHASGPLAMLVM